MSIRSRKMHPCFKSKILLTFITWVGATSLAVAQEGNSDQVNPWFAFFGHFHALVVHLPIGFLLLVGLMEGSALIFKKLNFGHAVTFGLGLSSVSSLVAVIFGYMLSLDGGYGEELLNRHMWLGFALTASTFALLLLKIKNMDTKIYYPFLTLSLLLLTATGHYGGSLTHGEEYLTQHMPNGLKRLVGIGDLAEENALAQVQNMDEAIVFKHIIQPIIDDKCVSCHNTSKSKGGLQMHTFEALMKGGESGQVITANSLDNSLLIKQIHLPLAEEEHMPPKGKPQLKPNEIELLEWWVTTGAQAETIVADLDKTEEIEEILQKMSERLTPKVNPVFLKNVSAADTEDVLEARANNIYLAPLTAESPFLHVRLNEAMDDWEKLLKPMARQVVSLDLSRTNCDDRVLESLEDFEHLTKLYLQNTSITDQGLRYLRDMPFLEYLNLYGTGITDAGLANLGEMEHLKQLFVWNTSVGDQAIEELNSKLPELVIEKGIDIQQLDTVRLAKPFIEAERPIFKDTTEVKLTLGIENVKIYYTTDGKDPDENSSLYSGPIEITSSCTIKAIAAKEGWKSSKPASMDFIKVKFLIQSAQIKNPPSDQYRASGAISLIDSKRGSSDFRDNQWLGFHEVDLEVQLDMGTAVDVQKITLGCFEDIASYIFFPTSIHAYYSNDGINYRPLTSATIPKARSSRPASIKNFVMESSSRKARYLKLVAKSVGRCPQWHPGAGDKAWIFVDEVIIE